MKYLFYSLFISFLFLQGCGSDEPNSSTNARVMVWQFVEGKLKDPGSAEFGPCEMTETTDGGWKTESYVDAKNSFGGTQRIYFTCEVKHKSGETWELVSLEFDE